MEYCTTSTCKRKLAKIEGERYNKIVVCEMFFRIIKNLEYLLMQFYKCLLVHGIHRLYHNFERDRWCMEN